MVLVLRGLGSLAMLAAIASCTSTVAAEPLDKKACIKAFDDAQDLRKDGKLTHARERLLACADPACPKLVRADCLKGAESIDAEIPTVVVKVVRGGSDVADATLTVDGKVAVVDGKPLALDPGPHTLVAKAGTETATEKVVLATGEKNRVVTVSLPAVVAQKTVTKADEAPRIVPASRPVWPWISLGVSVVALGGFTVLGLTARADYRALEARCAPACTDDEVSPVRRRFLLADVALGVSAVALGVAIFGFTRSSGPPPVSLSVGSGLALVTFGGRL